MKKTLKTKLINGIRLFLVVATLISNFSFIPSVSASSDDKGAIVKSTVKSNSEELKEGEVGLEKSISKISGTDDTYTVTLTATGKDIVDESITKIYAAIAFDNSSSMGDGDAGDIKGDKYNNAMNGAIKFSEELLKALPKSEIALVSYHVGGYRDVVTNECANGTNTCAEIERNFGKNSNKPLTKNDFPEKIGNLTNITGGVRTAADLLRQQMNKNTDPNAEFYLILLSDGVATSHNTSGVSDAIDAKNDGINIITIGYDDDGTYSDGVTGSEVLQKISSPNSYFKANVNNVETMFNNAFKKTISTTAGTDATITDVIADNFEYVENSACIDNVCTNLGNKVTLSNDKKTITFNVGDLGSATVSFQIKLTNRDLQEGEYPTNDKATVDYTDPDGNNPDGPEIAITDSPVINWIPDEYSYTINYYKDEISEANKIGESLTGAKTLNAIVEVEENLRKPTGYNEITSNLDFTISKTESENIINVIYTKKNNLSYTINYYKDSVNTPSIGSETQNNQTYGNEINKLDITPVIDLHKPSFGYKSGVIQTNMPLIIQDGENIIDILYEKRDDFKYTVKYVDETGKSLIENKVVNNVTYLEEVTENAKEAPFGYVLVGENAKEVTIDQENIVITFNYEKRADFKYTVKYLEKDTDKVLYPEAERTNKTYLETYKEEAINITGYNVVVNNNETNPRFVTINEEDMEVIFYYIKKNDLSYTINYYQDDITKNPIGTTPIENQTFGDIINSEDILVNVFKPEKGYKDGVIVTDMPYEIQDGENTIQICYSRKDNLTYRVEYYYDDILDESKTEYYTGKTYEEVIDTYEDKVIDGYMLIKDTAPLTIDDSDNNVIKVYYVSVGEGEVEYIEPPKTGVEASDYQYISLIGLMLSGLVLLIKTKKEN